MTQSTESVYDFVRGVRLSARPTPTERMQKQRTAIDAYKRAFPNETSDEVFAALSRINPQLFADGVRADQAAVVVPRLMKLPGASDSDNQDAAERSALAALVALHTRSYPTKDWNQMFADLGRKHPDVFNDQALVGPAGDI
jgi:hypothetical protein